MVNVLRYVDEDCVWNIGSVTRSSNTWRLSFIADYETGTLEYAPSDLS